METDENQNINIAVLNNELKNISEKIAAGFSRGEGVFKMFEEKNCRKHQEILATSNKYLGKVEKEIEHLKEHSINKEQLDRLIQVNQADIADNRKKLRELEEKQGITWGRLSLIWVAFTMIGVAALNFLIDLIKKKIE